ncbi:MAG: hypothetical protein RLY66_353 [Candidatus Parcubacteria bacterium]|jgi:hypothetical protein
MTPQTNKPTTPLGRIDAWLKQMPPLKRCLIILAAGVTLGLTVFLWNYGGVIIQGLMK